MTPDERERASANTALRDVYLDWEGSELDFVTLSERMNAAAAQAVRKVRAKLLQRA